MTFDLFDPQPLGLRESIGAQAFVLRRFALPCGDELLPAIATLTDTAPFRNMVTPGGFTMSVAMTNCGRYGWATDRRGYRYTERDPDTGKLWPTMPASFIALAQDAAQAAGFVAFHPDACLVNRYLPGSRKRLHQDNDERDLDAPIVSVSLGAPAVFLFGGHERTDKAVRIPLQHGDVVVWGGPTPVSRGTAAQGSEASVARGAAHQLHLSQGRRALRCNRDAVGPACAKSASIPRHASFETLAALPIVP